METPFRTSMNWLHTWAGVVLGGLLFAIFWSGTLSVFDREIDLWMAPTNRVAPPIGPISIDRAIDQMSGELAQSQEWYIMPPADRQPTLRIVYRAGDNYPTRHIDPRTGEMLASARTLAGTGFILPFHQELYLHAANVGIWLVGFAGMAMLALMVSGVVIHRKIFADFFTFRPTRKSRRVLLDLHNMAGVLGLPFHIAITLSGVAIFAATYFPSGARALYNEPKALFADGMGGTYRRAASDVPAGRQVSLDAIAAKAQQMWGDGAVEMITVTNPADAAGYITVERSTDTTVTHFTEKAWFDVQSGALLYRTAPTRPAMRTTQFLAGLHLVRFHHWTLRWLYFVMGLSGCVLIATGYLFWLESRRKRHHLAGLIGVRVVEAMTIGSITGIILATLAFFIMNRSLPLDARLAGITREYLEVWTFFLTLLAGFIHASLRPGRAWREQCSVAALFAATAVLLNWVTTGDHLIRTITHRHLWPIAGMDLVMLVGGGLAAYSALKLGRPEEDRGRDARPLISRAVS